MDDENNKRLIFRPTDKQLKRFNKLMASGKYRTSSELLRHIMEIGMYDLEKKP